MVMQGQRVETRSIDGLSVGSYLASGNLADVYKVEQNGQESHDWVLKVTKPGITNAMFLKQEYEFISKMREGLAYDPKSQSFLPEVALAQIEGQSALLLERMYQTLNQYARDLKQRTSLYQWEHQIWQLALEYAYFISKMHDMGYTCNDRKLNDFYYLESDYEKHRLVVLDWNVVERIVNSKNGQQQDARFLARAWFGLFGGGDEAKFDMNSRRQEDFSVVGRYFLWKILNQDLFTDNYRDATLTSNILEKQLNELLRIFDLPDYELEHELRRVMQAQPLSSLQAKANSSVEYDLLIQEHWQYADMLYRKTNNVSSELQEIIQSRQEFRQETNERIWSNLSNSYAALEQLNTIRNRGSKRQQAIIELWKENVNILQKAVNEGYPPTQLREVIREWQLAAETFAIDSESLESQASKFQQAAGLLRSLLEQPPDELGGETRQMIQMRLTQTGIFLDYIQGEIALLDGDPGRARSIWKKISNQINGLDLKLQQLSRELLPQDFTALENTDGSENQFLDEIASALVNGQFTEGLQIYRAAQQSPYVRALDLNTAEQWLRPARLIQDIETMPTNNWLTTLDKVHELVLYRQQHPQLKGIIERYLELATTAFMLMADKKRPMTDHIALRLAEKIETVQTTYTDSYN